MSVSTVNQSLPVWYWVIWIAVIAFYIVTRWIAYRKAGEHGWACIIPFYADYCLCRIAKKPKLFLPWLITLIAAVVVSIIMGIWIVFSMISSVVGLGKMLIAPEQFSFSPFGTAIAGIFIFFVILIAIGIVCLILQIFILHGVSVSFGHGAGFTVGLVLLPIVFWAILAFGKSKYNFERPEENAGAGNGYGGVPNTNITCPYCGTRFFYDESYVAPGQTFTCICPACTARLQFVKK